MGLSGPFQRLDVLGFKKTIRIALQAPDTVRQAITALLLDRYTGVQIDRNLSLVFMRVPACRVAYP